MVLGYRLHQTETQTMAGLLTAAGLHPIKAPKHILALGSGNTGTGIGDHYAVPRATCGRSGTQLYADIAVLGRVLDSVVQHIGKHLEQQVHFATA